MKPRKSAPAKKRARQKARASLPPPPVLSPGDLAKIHGLNPWVARYVLHEKFVRPATLCARPQGCSDLGMADAIDNEVDRLLHDGIHSETPLGAGLLSKLARALRDTEPALFKTVAVLLKEKRKARGDLNWKQALLRALLKLVDARVAAMEGEKLALTAGIIPPSMEGEKLALTAGIIPPRED